MAQMDQIDIRTAPSNLNKEAILQGISDISHYPTPFQDMISRESHTNPFFEWIADSLGAIVDNKIADGTDAGTAANDPAIRLGNHAQISIKVVGASFRVEASSNAGNESLARQVQKHTYMLQRDVERTLLLNNANVIDLGVGGTAGETAGLEAWLDTEGFDNVTKSPATVIDASGDITLATKIGGWSDVSSLIVPAIDYGELTTPGALSFADVKSLLNALYAGGGTPSVLMAIPKVIEKLSAFMYTSSAQIASLIRNTDGNAAQAQSSVTQIITDHGIVVDLVSNRMQALSGDSSPDCGILFALEPGTICKSNQGGGIKVTTLPHAGLGFKTMITEDYGLLVKNPDALGAIICIDEDLAGTA